MLDLGKTAKTHAHLSDLIKLSSDDSYEPGSARTPTFGNGGLDEGGSGASTPPLWRPESPESRRRNYAAMSPRSRTEAIARGQMELMEMVKDMPESSYELSLKDLVEVNRNHQGIGQERDGQGQKGSYVRHAGPRVQRQQRYHHGQMVRSGSIDGNSGGFLLKMVFPLPWGARKKKKKKTGGFDANSRNNGVNSNGASEKEWWKTRASVSTSAHGESAETGGESSSLTSGSQKSSISSSSSGSSSRSNSSSRRYT
ncbi:hypothetical protein CDL15_Pgr027929 [Punica granatum]|uniref:Uncharacterized protein n=1 Tax=Punica granatum TaxID=22663 RepID=A0A218XLE8_PUNGR|nr:hypothetical protein CDL15_Pgr027929 [Punica granatum]